MKSTLATLAAATTVNASEMGMEAYWDRFLRPDGGRRRLAEAGELGGPNDSSATDLSACWGECDSDAQCKKGLKCFQRTGYTPVPGCKGLGRKDWDYCYDPRGSIELSGGNDGNAKNLQACTGECDSDAQCASGLKCFQRSSGETIPGCTGPGAGGDWDYCYDPNWSVTNYLGGPNDSSATDLSACWGECDNDAQCKDGLKCFQRSGLTPVPGCKGLGKSGWDYCYDPTGSIELSGGNDGSAKNLQACTGECDSDAQCAAGLKCFQRSSGETIPGCTGSGAGGDWDYCYDPNWSATDSQTEPTLEPTVDPTSATDEATDGVAFEEKGAGYCRDSSGANSYTSDMFCVETYQECAARCSSYEKNGFACKGFAFAENPAHNHNDCMTLGKARCVLYTDNKVNPVMNVEGHSGNMEYTCYTPVLAYGRYLVAHSCEAVGMQTIRDADRCVEAVRALGVLNVDGADANQYEIKETTNTHGRAPGCLEYSKHNQGPSIIIFNTNFNSVWTSTAWKDLYVICEQVPEPADPGFSFLHEGHCAGGWLSPNTVQETLQGCYERCENVATCGYFSYEEQTGTCATYTGEAGCPDDDLHGTFKSYKMTGRRRMESDDFDSLPAPTPEI